MDDMYWSIERCGWAPCRGGHEAVATTWDVDDEGATPAVLPQQRVEEPARADA
jgi:hypothetical protein